MRKTVDEYEAEGWYMVMDDTPPEEEIVWTEEELKAVDELIETLINGKFKHHFEKTRPKKRAKQNKSK